MGDFRSFCNPVFPELAGSKRGVLVLAADAELAADVVGRLDHVEGAVDVIRLAFRLAFDVGVDKHAVAVAHAEAGVADVKGSGAHALRAACQHDVGIAALDLLRRTEHRLHPRGALAVHGIGGGRLGNLRHQRGYPRDIGRFGTLLPL